MPPIRTLPLVLLTALACAKPLPTQAPIAASPLALASDEWRVADHVIVITDASGTMYANETFPQAKALTRGFVASMPARDVRAARDGTYQAGFIGFGGDARSGAPLAPFERSALASNADRLEIMGSIDGMGGGTPLHAVLEEVAEALVGREGVVALVIFSDGQADDNERALLSGAALVETYPDDVCIHTVQTGDDPEGGALLAQLAGLTSCGSTRPANQLEDETTLTAFTRSVFAGPATPPVAAGPCAGVVRLQGIEFAFDRYDVTPDSGVVLDAAVEMLRECDGIQVQIDGHTDSIGTEGYNQSLSERRADAVKRHFVGDGVGYERLTTRGYGESDPISPNDTRDGRARNRRVELRPAE